MYALKTIDIIESVIPISRFNKGEANKIFQDVKTNGMKIVMKNNVPECILMSPNEYRIIMKEYEEAMLLSQAKDRDNDNSPSISQKEILEEFDISEEELKNIEVDFE